jgi:subtilisin family serine protease
MNTIFRSKAIILMLFGIIISSMSLVSQQQMHTTIPPKQISPFFKDKNGKNYYPHTLIIKFKTEGYAFKKNRSAIFNDIEKIFENQGVIQCRQLYEYFSNPALASKDIIGAGRIFQLFFTGNEDPEKICERLRKISAVEYAYPSYHHDVCLTPNDSLFSIQYEHALIKTEQAWDITTGGSAIIAIVDTECDWEHEDLAENIWLNPGENGIDNMGNDKSSNGIDDDGNGKIDDFRGWDFAGDITWDDFYKGIIREDNDTKIHDPNSTFNHGTFTASNASAVTNNGKGLSAAGFSTKLIPVKVRSDFGAAFFANEGLMYAAAMGADIISCSFTGLGYDEYEREVLRQVEALGSLVIESSGNDYYNNDAEDYVYLSYPHLMYVGASNDADMPAHFTNYGITTAVFAPGTAIMSAVPYNKYYPMNGTSMSSPIVAGIAALVKSQHPDWSPRQVMHQLRSTADRIFYPDTSHMQPLFYGRLNAYRALSVNKSFLSGETMPGIECIDVIINDDKAAIDNYNANVVELVLKNYLASVANLKIDILTLDTLVFINGYNHQTIDFEGPDSITSIFFNIQLNQNTRWYHKETCLLLKFSSIGYVDYQLIKLKLAAPPSNSITVFTDKVNCDFKDIFGQYSIVSISAPDVNNLWVAGIDSIGKSFYGITSMKQRIGAGYIDLPAGLQAKYISSPSIFKAVVVCEDSLAAKYVYYTTDMGKTWSQSTIEASVTDISNVNFSRNGIGIMQVSSMFMPYSNVLVSEDYGKSWHYPITVFQPGYELFMPQSMSILEDRRCFSSASGNFYISDDNGLNWVRIETTGWRPIFYLLSTANENEIAGICGLDTNMSVNYFAYSTNTGMTWIVENNRNLSEFIDSPSKLITSHNFTWTDYAYNDANCVLLTSNGDLFFTDNLGKEWYPVKNQHRFGDYGELAVDGRVLASSVRDSYKTRLWLAGKYICYIDLDDVFYHKYPISGSGSFIDYFSVYPSPVVSGEFEIQFKVNKGYFLATISIYNSLGNILENFNINHLVQTGQFETIKLNSDNYPSGAYWIVLKYGLETKSIGFIISH